MWMLRCLNVAVRIIFKDFFVYRRDLLRLYWMQGQCVLLCRHYLISSPGFHFIGTSQSCKVRVGIQKNTYLMKPQGILLIVWLWTKNDGKGVGRGALTEITSCHVSRIKINQCMYQASILFVNTMLLLSFLCPGTTECKSLIALPWYVICFFNSMDKNS